MGGSEDFRVRTRGLIQPLDLPLPRSRRLLGTAVDEPNLGQKPKLGGVRTLVPFHCIFRFVRFDLFEVFAYSSLFFYFAKTTKIFLFSFILSFEKPQKDFLSL